VSFDSVHWGDWTLVSGPLSRTPQRCHIFWNYYTIYTTLLEQPGIMIFTFSKRGIGFHRWAKLLDLNFFMKKLSARWSNQVGKIAATQFARCWVLKPLQESPTYKLNLVDNTKESQYS